MKAFFRFVFDFLYWQGTVKDFCEKKGRRHRDQKCPWKHRGRKGARKMMAMTPSCLIVSRDVFWEGNKMFPLPWQPR